MSRQSSTGGEGEATGSTAAPGSAPNGAADASGRGRPRHTYPGLSPRAERVLTAVAVVVVIAFAVGWAWSIAALQPGSSAPASRPGGALLGASAVSAAAHGGPPMAAYVTGAAVTAAAEHAIRRARGESGQLAAAFVPAPHGILPDTARAGAAVRYAQGQQVRERPVGAGVWRVLLDVGSGVRRPVTDFRLISMLPFTAKERGRIGLYYLGTWPSERGVRGPSRAPPGAYGNPKGFIEVTRENANTPVSVHFRLRDFLTHDQPKVWPKYLVLQPRLVDKLELVLTDLQARGVDPRGVHVMSGFRTPQYNYTGGNTAGRAGLSRHMYGDASDIFIDNDGDGVMDDLDHDGRITAADARVIAAAVDRVEAAHPELVGGTGVYSAGPGHGPFIHIDTRGYRARWAGTSGG